MQLIKLEIKGFKSFGDKVIINFDDGVTGIVGPNGCGKSNIVDAVRWVLGEQRTKALRSEKMDNVIFNGTKRRKPLQMAEVSLTFDNTKNLIPTEYTQVQITRRYYRSGESEYLLNNVICRLKDINELFLDTGIGSDSYAIIELKMIDDLLNDKENSRRTLFEEAAGVSKFKVRKKQTLKKLDDTDKDLERVDDILYEIEKNLKSLEKQAKQAEKYLGFREQQKKYSVQLAKRSIQRRGDELEKHREGLLQHEKSKLEVIKKLGILSAEIERLKVDLVKGERLLASRQKTLNDFVNNLRQQESDKKLKNERLVFLNDKSASLKENLAQDKKRADLLHLQIIDLEKSLASTKVQVNDIDNHVKSLKVEYDAQKENVNLLKSEINHSNTSLKKFSDVSLQLKKSLELNQIQLDKLLEEVAFATISAEEQLIESKELEGQLMKLAAILNEKNDRLDELDALKKVNDDQILDEEKKGNLLREELILSNRKIDARQNEFNLTKSLVENLEGFPEAIKFLKKNTKLGKSAPLLSDIISCDVTYRVAIENYLDSVMSHYIVSSASDAYAAVNILGESSKGKASFYLLDTFEGFRPKKIEKIMGATAAIDLVQYDVRYQTLVQYLLDDVYVSDSDDLPTVDHIFISRSGKVSKTKYSVAGGSVGLFEGKRIGRVKNLQNLEVEIKDLDTKRDAIKLRLDKSKSRLSNLKNSTLKIQIKNTQKEVNEKNQEYIATRLRFEQLQSQVTARVSKDDSIQQNIKILEEAQIKGKPKLDLQLLKIRDIESEIIKETQELRLQEELLSEKSNVYNEENLVYHQYKNKLESIQQEISYKTEISSVQLERIQKNSEKLLHTENEIIKLLERKESKEGELLSKYEEKEAIEKGVIEAEKNYYECRSIISTKEELFKHENSNQSKIDAFILENQKLINEVKLSFAGVKERLSVEFNVNINQLNLEEEEDDKLEALTEEELSENIQLAKERISKMGPINSMAMEAFGDIKKRYDFITLQRKDLQDAKASLTNTIKEIDEVAKDNFLSAFSHIRENFIHVFRSLFTDEDTCDVTLRDPEHPLDSKIDIIARPKGKRPLTINQLSGGEKTLTAVALLFSIYLIKPAPFCIFDEVDAPLDDANIDKFNKIIRKFSKDSQFIIVTHNKRTMSTTDIIYGVTMQETGVSRLVPVDLRNLETYGQSA